MTAKELYDKMLQENDEATTTEMMIEFARLKVTEALIVASENLKQTAGQWRSDFFTQQRSILKSFPLEQIK